MMLRRFLSCFVPGRAMRQTDAVITHALRRTLYNVVVSSPVETLIFVRSWVLSWQRHS